MVITLHGGGGLPQTVRCAHNQMSVTAGPSNAENYVSTNQLSTLVEIQRSNPEDFERKLICRWTSQGSKGGGRGGMGFHLESQTKGFGMLRGFQVVDPHPTPLTFPIAFYLAYLPGISFTVSPIECTLVQAKSTVKCQPQSIAVKNAKPYHANEPTSIATAALDK